MVTAYLKAQCGWSRGIREVLGKYGIDYKEKQIHIAENYIEMVEKTGQAFQPCVQLSDEIMLADISGEELENYLVGQGYTPLRENNDEIPLDESCTDEEHQRMRQEVIETIVTF